jgi:tripartite-type tricarboxylate transporter receptor subunit TctC
MTALMAGELQLLMAGLSTVLPQAKSGKIKVLAVTGAQRTRVAPEVPTVAESGVPGYAFDVWYGMMVPAGTPRPIIARLHDEIARLLKSPLVSERFASIGLEPVSNTPEEFAALLQREVPRWKRIVRDANVHVE